MANFDNKLLDEHIKANKLDYPRTLLLLVAAVVALEPVYFSHAINNLSLLNPFNLVLYVMVSGATVYMLHRAYVTMIESDFWTRQRGHGDGKEEKALRKVRLQVSIAYCLFFINTVFFVVCTVLMSYIFRHMDPRGTYILSPTMAAAFLWLLAQKNEESRIRRMRQHN